MKERNSVSMANLSKSNCLAANAVPLCDFHSYAESGVATTARNNRTRFLLFMTRVTFKPPAQSLDHESCTGFAVGTGRSEIAILHQSSSQHSNPWIAAIGCRTGT